MTTFGLFNSFDVAQKLGATHPRSESSFAPPCSQETCMGKCLSCCSAHILKASAICFKLLTQLILDARPFDLAVAWGTQTTSTNSSVANKTTKSKRVNA